VYAWCVKNDELPGKVAMIRQIGFAACVFAVSLPAVANADSQGDQLMKKWVGSDHCSERAYQAYPDYTADSLAKRDLEFKKCLANGNLPPRDLPPPNRP
jgi:hypothetical protein